MKDRTDGLLDARIISPTFRGDGSDVRSSARALAMPVADGAGPNQQTPANAQTGALLDAEI